MVEHYNYLHEIVMKHGKGFSASKVPREDIVDTVLEHMKKDKNYPKADRSNADAMLEYFVNTSWLKYDSGNLAEVWITERALDFVLD